MPAGEFKTIRNYLYLSQCHDLLLSSTESNEFDEELDALTDQKVPQPLLSDSEPLDTQEENVSSAFYSFIKPKPEPNSHQRSNFLLDYSDFDPSSSLPAVDFTEKIEDEYYRESSQALSSSYNTESTIDIDNFDETTHSSESLYTYNCDGPNGIEALVNQVKSDIAQNANFLGISPDPCDWSENEVQVWIQFTLQQLNLTTEEAKRIVGVPGKELCSLTETDFCYIAPKVGSQLFLQLNIWKCASKVPSYTPVPNPDRFSYETSLHHRSALQIEENSNPHTRLIPEYSVQHENDCHPSAGPDVSMESRSSELIDWDFTRSGRKQTIHLWEFLLKLLLSEQYSDSIRWLDRSHGIFKIENSTVVARLWGNYKNRPAMNYDKLSRSIRQYYKKGIIKKTSQSKRLVYQFCSKFIS